MDTKMFLFIGMAAIGLAILFQIVAVGTTHWLLDAFGNHSGLFKACQRGSDKCFDFAKVPAGLMACRFFAVTAILVMLATLATLIVNLLKSIDKLRLVSMILAFVSAIAAFAAVASISAAFGDKKAWSFHLAWFSGILSLVAGIMIYIFRKKSAEGASS